MQGEFHHVGTVLERKAAGTKTFPAFKDSPGNPLGRTPRVKKYRVTTQDSTPEMEKNLATAKQS